MLSDAALYYPRIRIQDPNWLKMTLLCFGRVCRITPGSYTANDSETVKECCETEGPNGMLVGPAKLWEAPVQMELLRLRDKINSADETLLHRFTKQGYLENGEDPKLVDSFEIHRRKIDSLVQTLESRKLAWAPPDGNRGEEWLAVHPELGDVIMSILAVAVAKNEGLSIVTPSPSAHRIATSLEDQLVLEALLGLAPKIRADNASDLIQVVMRSVVYDISGLTVKDIAELLKEKRDLISLRGALESIASRIPAVESPERRHKLVREAAVDAIDEWKKDNPSRLAEIMPFSRDIIEIGETVVQMRFLRAAVSAVAFSLRLVSGDKEKDQAKNRFKFLNVVDQMVNPDSSTLLLPAFGNLA